jgi:hypothetical protein
MKEKRDMDTNVALGAMAVCIGLIILATLAWIFMGCADGWDAPVSIDPPDHSIYEYTKDTLIIPLNDCGCPPKRRCLFVSDLHGDPVIMVLPESGQ